MNSPLPIQDEVRDFREHYAEVIKPYIEGGSI